MLNHIKTGTFQFQDDSRQSIELSKFGFLQDGILSVNFSDFSMDLNNKHKGIGGTVSNDEEMPHEWLHGFQ